MSTEPPPAPLYLHDLADFLHAHLLTHSSSTSHYHHLRTLYIRFSFSRIHTSFPRTISQPLYEQHLFQAVLTLNASLLQNLCCPTHTTIPIPARIALLTLLYITQPPPRQQIRITHQSLETLFQHTSSSCEAAQLINYLTSVHAFRVVPYLVHSPAHAPNDIFAHPFPPLLKFWRPSLLYGYHVPPHAAIDALNQRFNPACPSARIARLKSIQIAQLP